MHCFRSTLRLIAIAAPLVCARGRLFAQHDMSSMGARVPLNIPPSRMGSGTSWLPDSTRVPATTDTWGTWMISFHGAAFAQFDDQFTKRGDKAFGVVDWEMLMAMRSLGGGQLQLRAMTSLEPFTLGGSGYPELLQTGGTYKHSVIHDRQHPHNAIMELAALYERELTSDIEWSLYAGAAGEPASGPVAYGGRYAIARPSRRPVGEHLRLGDEPPPSWRNEPRIDSRERGRLAAPAFLQPPR